MRQTCPLKMVGIMANSTLALAAMDPSKADSIQAATKCDRERCGFWSSFTAETENEDESVTKKRIEGCGLALLPEQVYALGDVIGSVDAAVVSLGGDVASVAGEVEAINEFFDGVKVIVAEKAGVDFESLIAKAQELREATVPEGDDEEPGEPKDDE